MSEPHTSDRVERRKFSDICMYRTCIHCTCTRVAYGQYERDLTTHTHLETFMVAFLFKILQFRVVMLLVVNIDTLTTSRRATMHERTREGLTCSRDS